MRLFERLAKLASSARRRLRAWTAWVWKRVTDEPGYVEGVADLSLAVANLLVPGSRSRRILIAAVLAAVVVFRTISRRNEEGEPQQLWV